MTTEYKSHQELVETIRAGLTSSEPMMAARREGRVALDSLVEQLEAAQKERDDAKQALAIFFEIMPEVTGRFFADAHDAWADGRERKWDDQRFREEISKALAGHYPASESQTERKFFTKHTSGSLLGEYGWRDVPIQESKP